MKKVITSIVVAFIMTAVVALGYFEFSSRYEAGKRYEELDNWALYGDALIRFTKSKEYPADAIVVKDANKQIDDYAFKLRDGKCWAMYDLDLAMQGKRRASDALGALDYAAQFVTLQSPEWPFPKTMTDREQKVRVDELNQRILQYDQYLERIDSARADTLTTTATN